MTLTEQRMVFVAKWRPFVMCGLRVQESDKPTLEFDADLDALIAAVRQVVGAAKESP